MAKDEERGRQARSAKAPSLRLHPMHQSTNMHNMTRVPNMGSIGMKITNFHYSQAFPPRDPSLAEYPKWIHMKGYASEVVDNAEHEAHLLARPPKDGPKLPDIQPEQPPAETKPPGEVLVGANDERAILEQIAKERGIKTDGRWNISRLRATVERETKDL
jgi:hypothetical protein